jgi:GNAT superfamily N-acetyltransferase
MGYERGAFSGGNMSLVLAIEPVSSTWNEVMVLANQHWAGTKSYRRHEPFNPSFERYNACNQSGFFQLFTARDQGVLVGYFGVYITDSMHSQKRMATEDTFFLEPSHRGGRNALRFLRFIEKQCAEWGVKEIMFSCEIDNETGIQGLLKFVDYSPVIMQYSKQLTVSTSPDRAHDSSAEVSDVCPIATPST